MSEVELQQVVQAQGAELKQLRTEIDRMQSQMEKVLHLLNRQTKAIGDLNGLITSHREILEKIIRPE